MTKPKNTHPSLSDYSHWGEEASIIKAQEDKWADYYRSEPTEDDYYEEES